MRPKEIALCDGPCTDSPRAAELFQLHQQSIYQRTDRVFGYLMPLQWWAAFGAACWISPLTWEGTASHTHPHVWMALLLGGAIASLPTYLAFCHPGALVTRHVIAVSQMLMSALLIHLTGGRIETHFHVFGSLAFLAFYRDWRVFIPATGVIAADHLIRGLYWPQSVFGSFAASEWRWLEHAGWVLFEDAFLIISCQQNVREMSEIARQRAQLERTQHIIEQEVVERTNELAALERQHIEVARRAGMAEIATSVLHNVGNVLNSVNVATSVISEKLKHSGTRDLRQATALLEQHLPDVSSFVSQDQRGKHLPRFLIELGQKMSLDEDKILSEVTALSRNIEHIKEIVSVQQSYAGISGLIEDVCLSELVEDAIRINAASFARHHIELVRDFDVLPTAKLAKHKFLQIVVNLLSNAKDAIAESKSTGRQITVRIRRADENYARIEVQDTGIGISSENLTRIFSHGFTTRSDGHGFGLHSAANLAGELNGRLTAASDGPGQGATFVLELPLTSSEVSPPTTSRNALASGSRVPRGPNRTLARSG